MGLLCCYNARMVKKGSKQAPKKRVGNRTVMSKRQTQLLEGAMAGGFAFVIGSVFLMSSLQSFFMATNQFAAVVNSVLVDLTNTDRAAYNLQGLTVNEKLVAAAQAKADDMAAKGYFAHTSPEGLDSWHWFKQAKYDFQSAGENLAVDFSDSADVERAWMNSPSHRDNILNGRYTEIGIATAVGMYQGHSTTFVVTMFGSPRAASAASPAPSQPAFSTVPSNRAETATAQNPSTVLGEQLEQAENPIGDTTPVTVPQVKSQTKPATVQPIAAAEKAPVEAMQPASSPRPPVGPVVRHAEDWQMLATSPSTTLKYSYYLLALLVLLALAIDTGLEIHWHHRKRAATAGFMLAAMGFLFWYANYSMFTETTVAESGVAATQTL